MKYNKKILLLIKFFEINALGFSREKTRNEINNSNLFKAFKIGDNGNGRNGILWGIKEFKFDIQRKNNKNNGKLEAVKINGFNNEYNNIKRPINKEIKNKLLEKYNQCFHCGIHTNLVIDHKNDMYNDHKVLNKQTQTIDNFQVLCNRCNNSIKDHIAHKFEKNNGILYKSSQVNIIYKQDDNFPWNKSLKTYDENEEVVYINGYDIHCKMYTYWYDIEKFHNRREWYIKFKSCLYELINLNSIP